MPRPRGANPAASAARFILVSCARDTWSIPGAFAGSTTDPRLALPDGNPRGPPSIRASLQLSRQIKDGPRERGKDMPAIAT